MSIYNLREAGFDGVTMRYEMGGQICVYKWNGKEASLPSNASLEQIKKALSDTTPSDQLNG